MEHSAKRVDVPPRLAYVSYGVVVQSRDKFTLDGIEKCQINSHSPRLGDDVDTCQFRMVRLLRVFSPSVMVH